MFFPITFLIAKQNGYRVFNREIHGPGRKSCSVQIGVDSPFCQRGSFPLNCSCLNDVLDQILFNSGHIQFYGPLPVAERRFDCSCAGFLASLRRICPPTWNRIWLCQLFQDVVILYRQTYALLVKLWRDKFFEKFGQDI